MAFHNFKWGKYTSLYEKGIKEAQNKPMETTYATTAAIWFWFLWGSCPLQLGPPMRMIYDIVMILDQQS